MSLTIIFGLPRSAIRSVNSRTSLPAIRREQLDAAVLNALEQRIVQPEHLESLLAGMLDRSDAAEARKRKTLATARASKTDAQKAVANLLTLVERGR